MKSLQEFINEYTGQANVGDTPENKGQCVGLIEVWTDNLGLPHTWGNANQLLTDANPKFFDIIINNPNDTTQFPLSGDVICWDWGISGHTGIIVDADGNSFNSFEQNNPVGSTPHIVHHNYSGVMGWLHPHSPPPLPSPTVPTDDELRALKVLKDHILSSTDIHNQPFGNLEGYANTLTQDAYKAWKNPPIIPIAFYSFNQLVTELLRRLTGR